MPNSTQTLTAIVAGHVQRVGFRQFAQLQAVHYGLRGWAENREDGTVAVIVMGPRDQIEVFLARLRQGTGLIRVTDIHLIWGDRSGIPDDFAIR